MKFLIDECLPTELLQEATAGGHLAQHVSWIGKRSEKDWNLAPFAIENNLIIVTNNSKDFRGDGGEKTGFTTQEELHPGLICLNCDNEKRNKQMFIRLFQIALSELANSTDLINKVIEVTQHGDQVDVIQYEAPSLN